MAVGDAIVIAVIGVVIIEGIWLAALSYLMWRRSRARKEAEAADAPPPQ